jgi:hypothetical protein
MQREKSKAMQSEECRQDIRVNTAFRFIDHFRLATLSQLTCATKAEFRYIEYDSRICDLVTALFHRFRGYPIIPTTSTTNPPLHLLSHSAFLLDCSFTSLQHYHFVQQY